MNAGPFPDDIAVVLLAAPTSAPPIARATTTPVDGTATAAGWGAIDNAGTIYPSALQAATLAIQPQGDCGQALPICAGLTSPNICIGDSGGPLFTTVGTPVQLGVSSAVLQVGVDPCGGDSSMFTDVSLYTAWIDAQLVPAVAGVRVSVVAGKLRVSWQRTPGGAEPAVVVTTSDGTRHGAVTGATSLDVAGLPRGRALGATVTVTNAWGSASAASAGTATLPSPPVSTTRPKVTGKPKVGKTLTCGTGRWKATPAPSFAFGWRIGGKVSKTQKQAKLKLTKRHARQERLVHRDGEEPGGRGRRAQRRGDRPAPITSQRAARRVPRASRLRDDARARRRRAGARRRAPVRDPGAPRDAPCTGTCASSTTACSHPGRCRRASRPTRARTGSPSAPRTTRWSTWSSPARSREGEYGGGLMAIWDEGTFEEEKFRDDEVIVVLHGERVTGRYVLFQTGGKNWMIHRMDPPQDPAGSCCRKGSPRCWRSPRPFRRTPMTGLSRSSGTASAPSPPCRAGAFACTGGAGPR